MQDKYLRICTAQYDIAWEDKEKNIAHIANIASKLSEETDIIVLPEMSFTGFTFNTKMAETDDGYTLTQVRCIAKKTNIALCGSFIYTENQKYYNRAFFITPEGDSYFYNKRHLFRMGQEGEVLTSGNEKSIFEYKGFNICLMVCYDLRFPVWTRNVDNQYDLLIYVANWPEARKNVWNTLLKARAIENMSYVCGVNRIGKDNNKLNHIGDSMVVDQRGQQIISIPENKKANEIVSISKETLIKDRKNFPVWKDADRFNIEIDNL